jgi:predicted dithiol-disulfide oxidoreductase (DUF899 family)
VTNPAQIQAAAESVDALDVLVNAGIWLYDLSDRAMLEEHLAVNFFGTWGVTQAFLPLLTRCRGAIVNNLSLMALAALPLTPAYSASKAAAFSLTQSAARPSGRAGRAGACRPDRPHRHRSPGPSSTDCTTGRRRSSPIPCPRPSLTAGAAARPRRSSARTPRSPKHSPSLHKQRKGRRLIPRSSGTYRLKNALERRQATMSDHKVVGRKEWQAAREELLQREKQHTRMGDELARQRRELPWVRVDKPYRFDTDDGTRTLAELFDGRSQLLVYHFMFGPSYQAGDPVNSSIADGLNALLPHLHARDVTLLLVSRAPLAKLQAYKQRMGWRLPWVSAANTDFNVDLGASASQEQVPPGEGGLPPIVAQNAAAAGTDVVGYLSEAPAVSVFTLQDGVVYQTYATTWRGVEFLMGYYPILDRAPKGRDEGDGWQLWIRRHDEYNSP